MSDDSVPKGKPTSGARLKMRPEGPWDDVTRLIGQAHFMLHRKGIVRIQTDIRIGSRYGGPALLFLLLHKLTGLRTDKRQKFSEKVTAVKDILAADVQR